MSEEKEAAYQTEIARLNQIITVLLEQNGQLKADISNVKTWIAENNITMPNVKIWNGLSINTKSDDKTGVGFSEATLSKDKIGNGYNINTKSIDETEIGLSKTTMSISEIYIGQNKNTMSNDKTLVGQPKVAKQLPDILSTDGMTISRIAGKMHQNGVRYMSYAARVNVAKLLVHFYNKNSSRYSELRKLTGYSQGGISKFMTALRKRGLIENTGWQKYAPTAKALEIMRKALE